MGFGFWVSWTSWAHFTGILPKLGMWDDIYASRSLQDVDMHVPTSLMLKSVSPLSNNRGMIYLCVYVGERDGLDHTVQCLILIL